MTTTTTTTTTTAAAAAAAAISHNRLHVDPIDDDDDDMNLTQTAKVSNFDTQFFHRVVEDAGRWAFGVVMIEVWVMNDDKTHLFRPIGGLWVDPLAHDYGSNDKFARILDPDHDGFFKALPFSPGIGLPGILWSEGRKGNAAIDHPGHHSPFPNAIAPRHLPTLNRNRSVGNNNSGSGRGRRNHNRSNSSRSGNMTRRVGRLHRRGDAVQFETLIKSGLYDGGHNLDDPGAAADAETTMTDDRPSKQLHATHDENKDTKPLDGSHRHRTTAAAADIEAGDWVHESSSGRIITSGPGGRVKNAIAKNLPFNTTQVIWRDVAAIVDDPDQPFNPRIQYLLEDCGLGWAAGVPFHIGNTDGVVVYMARGTVNVEKLMGRTNEEYLAHVSLVIGSAYALRMPRLAVEKERRSEAKATWRKVKRKLHTIRALNRNIETFIEDEVPKDIDEKTKQAADKSDDDLSHGERRLYDTLAAGLTFITMKLTSTYKKSMGVQIQAPPATSWEQTCVTFFASLLTILILTSLSESLVQTYGPDFALVLGPFGAMSTLLYSLTSAPASQPRNAILGQTASLFIAYGFGQTDIDSRLKQSLATATSIAFMAKTGLTHPPAGASAMIFSGGSHSMGQIGVMLLGNVVAILLATVFNNLDAKRQYPTSWGYLFGCCTDLFIEEYYDSESEQMDPVIKSYANCATSGRSDHGDGQNKERSEQSDPSSPSANNTKNPGVGASVDAETVVKKRVSLAKLRRQTSSFLRSVRDIQGRDDSDGDDEVITA